MSVYRRSLIKSGKYFYRDNFRKLIMVTVVSYIITLLLAGAVFYVKQTQPKVNFYATNTAGFITPLKVLNEPNKSSSPLLKPDPKEELLTNKLPEGM